ncbi:Hypothetical predicted protein [Mytilus galloprovincialis]|uniref:Uncharacterized protein n=1 Tax=Mytilus galloprovincialis TaxID=29158 RepID=A0A8B6BUN6_MYTGA|nr:Hypothetical predicted protein [Mytilus galloprovincialis]
MGLNLPGSRAPASYCGFTLPASASNAMSWSRPPWSQGYPYSGFPGQGFHGQGFPDQGFPNQVFPSQVPSQPFPGFWPYYGPTPVIVSQSTTPNLSVPAPPLAVSSSCRSVSVPAALPTSSVRHQFNQVADSGPSLDGFKSILDDFRQFISSELTSFSNRLGMLENIANKSNSPAISLRPDHDIGSDLETVMRKNAFQLPQAAKKKVLLLMKMRNSVQVSQNVSQPSVPVSISSSVIGQSSTNSSKEPEAEDAPSTLKDLRDSVYTIMRDVNKVPFQSPPIPKKLTSTFKASCGLVDKALGASQLLIMGSIAYCTLSKTSEILDKAKVSDNLKDALINSPLDEKIFGLPLDEGQKHLNQNPAPVKRAVDEVPVSTIDPGFYSRLFLVSKKTGGMGPVIDLSILNSYMIIHHFKMETNRLIRASILPGLLNSLTDVVPLGRLHIRPLQFYLHQHWLPATQDWEFPVPIIHQELFPHLVWWTSQANILRGQLLSSPVPNQTLFTDASNLGWGAYLEGLSVSGV